MVKAEKRNRIDIYFDVLRLLAAERKSNNKLCLTKIAHSANLPYDRFRNCLDHLVQVGMASYEGNKLVVTEKGLEFIEEYKKNTDFLRRLGLVP
jgi:predicted transcriptional regulator